MTFMEVDSKDICRIIKLCADSGVSKLKISTLEVEFFGSGVVTTSTGKKITERPREQARVEQEDIELAEKRIREDQRENLILENPEEYERLIASGELTDEAIDNRRTESDLQ